MLEQLGGPEAFVRLSADREEVVLLPNTMAPDRGHINERDPSPVEDVTDGGNEQEESALDRTRSDHGCYASKDFDLQDKSLDRTNFTFRGVAAGCVIGIIIACSNTYFGLQTGWISGMTMPASLIGFVFFKSISKHLALPFTPVENVLVQTVAGAVGTMPLGLGFVGVMPALEFLLKKSEGAPMDLSLWRLIVWGVGLCLFGVVFGVPLRKQVIIRERLKFPSGTATALVISVLHGGPQEQKGKGEIPTQGTEEREELLQGNEDHRSDSAPEERERTLQSDWKKQIHLMSVAFAGSGTYTLLQYFVPLLHRLPVFGTYLANTWLWTLNPSPAYVGQGIIMGAATTSHMLLGALLGWAILSPVAKNNGWAPGEVSDWEHGSKGWIVWISLAIMLADAIVNLGWLVLRPTIRYGPGWYHATKAQYHESTSLQDFVLGTGKHAYSAVNGNGDADGSQKHSDPSEPPEDAPAHHLVSGRTVSILLPLTIIICVICTHVAFGAYIPISLNILAILLALVLSIMGVRALGETDLNPVSGISKLTQLIFALVVPTTGIHKDHAIIINLLAGAVSEAGALQAGDILQDLKAGHLIGASPKAQFYGQIIGSVLGAFVSAVVYKLYVSVYEIPGDVFQVPTGYVWIFTARLVTGQGLPEMSGKFALVFGVVFMLTTSLRIYLASHDVEWVRKIHPFVPGGIAVAVGMYNTPSFTLARFFGGMLSLWWTKWRSEGETKAIVLARYVFK